MKRLAIIVSHPIQYYAPLFASLSKSKNLIVKVFYTWNALETNAFDHGFQKNIKWDIPLLEGYDFTFVKNKSADAGTHHYFGLDNPGLIDEINNWNPDALLVYGWKYKSHLHVLKYFKNKKTIFFRGDSHNLDDLGFLKKTARKIVLNWVYKKIDYTFYVGQNNKEYFLEVGLKENQLIWAPHSVDNTRFTDDSFELNYKAERWRDELKIPSNAVVVLFAGKLEMKKQPLLLLRFAKELENENIYFVFAGNGEYEDEVIKASKNYYHIKYLPFQNQSKMPVLYRIADVFCLPSIKEETWGLAVNEAMACALPVIVSNKVGCSDDLVKHEINGFKFNVNNSNKLKEILNSLSGKKKELKEMGTKSLEIISDWSIEKQANAIENGILRKLTLVHEQESFSLVK